MIWVGSFESLQTVLGKHRFTGAPLHVHTWVRSEIALISPLVGWLMNLVAMSHCVCGEEQLVELALREALSNVMLHGTRLETASWFMFIAVANPAGKSSLSFRIRDEDSILIRYPIPWRLRISARNAGVGSI
jgi:hypothetical protein